jgi:hypothetical protein
MEAEQFHTSDLEFEAPESRWANAGQRSMEAMLEHAFEDRISSKKASNELEDDRGAPGTVENR